MHRSLRAFFLALALATVLAGAAPADTPAEAEIAAARERVEQATSPSERAAAYVALATAHTARARETGDPTHYAHALRALERARASDAPSEDVTKIEAWVRLGRHEFAKAEALAKSHLRERQDDHEAWGLLGDAQMELGRTEEAGASYQRMMDLRPGPGAYLRAAYYRERTGDLEGAVAFLERALAATGTRNAQAEQRAWTLVLLASLDTRLDRPERAASRLQRALEIFPDYHYALAAMARHHLAQGHPEQALAFARRALEVAPHAERWLILADALRATGREEEARAAEDAFERTALQNVDEPDNENVFLVDFYLDRRPDPERALALAQREAERRKIPAILERLARAEAATREEPGRSTMQ